LSSLRGAVDSPPAVTLADLTKEELTRLLREAENAHGQYEKELGERHADWAPWYAEFIVEKLRERAEGPGP
jgi:hypothetical protein